MNSKKKVVKQNKKSAQKKQDLTLEDIAEELDGFLWGFTDYHEANGLPEFLKAATAANWYASELGFDVDMQEYVFLFHKKRGSSLVRKATKIVSEKFWEIND